MSFEDVDFLLKGIDKTTLDYLGSSSSIRDYLENNKYAQRQIYENTNLLLKYEDSVVQIVKNREFLFAIANELIRNEDPEEGLGDELVLLNELIEHHLEVVSNMGSVIEKVVSTDRAINYLVRHEELLERLLSRGDVKRYLSSHKKVQKMALFELDELMNQSPVKSWLKNNHDYLGKIISDPEVLPSVTRRGDVAASVFDNEKHLNEYLIKDLDKLSRILNIGDVKKFILTNEDYLGKIVGSESAIEIITKNGKIRQSLISQNQFLDAICKSDTILRAAVSSGDVFQLILSPDEKPFIEVALVKFFMRGNSALIDEFFANPKSLIERFSVIEELLRTIKYLSKHIVPVKSDRSDVATAIAKILSGSDDIQNLCKLIFDREGYVILNGRPFYIIDWRGFWIAYHEIFVNEDYLFSTESRRPFVIDGGSNIGMATAYFKMIYPDSEVVCFEPSEKIREIIEKNIKSQGWFNVQLLPYALSDVEEYLSFKVPVDDSLAGHLSKIEGPGNYEVETVVTKKLSQFIHKSVDFMKLDIEGQELEVVRELGEKLCWVRNLFIEYHGEELGPPERFLALTELLTRAGFRFHVAKAMGTSRYTSKAPFAHLQGKYSLTIYGENLSQIERDYDEKE